MTYKLKLNHGDLKATQGDTGHAEIDMITKFSLTFWMKIEKSTHRSLKLPFIPTLIPIYCLPHSKKSLKT